MGIFKDLGKGLKKGLGLITNPVRGVGRILRGDFKKGLGDILPTAGLVAGGLLAPGAAGLVSKLGGGKLLGGLTAALKGAGVGGGGGEGAGGLFSGLAKQGGLLGGVGRALDAIGLGREGGLDAKHLLAGGAAVAGLNSSRKASKRQSQLLDEQIGLARKQAGYADELLGGARPIRQAAESALLGRLKAGRRAAPSLSGLVDSGNPFRAKFSIPGGGAVAPPPPAPSLRTTPPSAPAATPPPIGVEKMPPRLAAMNPRHRKRVRAPELI